MAQDVVCCRAQDADRALRERGKYETIADIDNAGTRVI